MPLKKLKQITGTIEYDNSEEIQYSDGKIPFEQTKWAFVGAPKIGKTELASGFENNYFLVHDPGEVQRLKGIPYYHVRNWKALDNRIDWLIENKESLPFKFLTFDYIDLFYYYAQYDVVDRAQMHDSNITDIDKIGYRKGYTEANTMFRRFIVKVFDSGYGLIFISHLQLKDVQNFKTGTTTQKAVATLPDDGKRILFPLLSQIGHVMMEEVKERKVINGKEKLLFPEKRVISFEPSAHLEGGNRDGKLPNKLVLHRDARKNYEMFKSYYEKGGENE
jgi:hypothetical protein